MKSHGRVLSVASTFPRWAGDATPRFVLDLAVDLQAEGWEVTALAPHAPGAATRETLEGVGVERFRYFWPTRLETLCDQSGALARLRSRRLEFLKVPAFGLAETTAVARRVALGGYDLLHSHWILPQGLAGALSAGPLGVPHVVTVHGGDIFGLRGAFMRALKRLVLRWADAITVNSSATAKAVADLAPDLRNVRRIPMGVAVATPDRDSPTVGQVRERYRRGAGPLLAFVGRLVPEKGVDDFLTAVAILVSEFPDIRGIIVGDGPNRAAFQRRGSELGLSERVRFTGWLQRKAVQEHLAAADVFVGPSRRSPAGWTEAQGLVFLEALAAGTPVVASRAGGIGDMVRDGETGLLVDEAAPHQIAQAVGWLVANPDRARTLAERGRSLVANEFSREASSRAFSDLFSSLLVSRGGTRR